MASLVTVVASLGAVGAVARDVSSFVAVVARQRASIPVHALGTVARDVSYLMAVIA